MDPRRLSLSRSEHLKQLPTIVTNSLIRRVDIGRLNADKEDDLWPEKAAGMVGLIIEAVAGRPVPSRQSACVKNLLGRRGCQ